MGILTLVHRAGCAIELWQCVFPGPSTFSLSDDPWCRCLGLALPSALVMRKQNSPLQEGFSVAAAELEQEAVTAGPAIAVDL